MCVWNTLTASYCFWLSDSLVNSEFAVRWLINVSNRLEILKKFLEELDEEGNLPPDFEKITILEAAKLVMRWNLFEYGDCFFKQLIGTSIDIGTDFPNVKCTLINKGALLLQGSASRAKMSKICEKQLVPWVSRF